jgi:hypothetical protein
MPTFQYEAMTSAGKPQNGTINAQNRDDAIAQIKAQGLFPSSVHDASKKDDERSCFTQGLILLAVWLVLPVTIILLVSKFFGPKWAMVAKMAYFVMLSGGVLWIGIKLAKMHKEALEALAAMACPKCGGVYGLAAAKRAAKETRAAIKESERRLPWGVEVYYGPNWRVGCACGATARFNYNNHRLTMDAEPPPEKHEG